LPIDGDKGEAKVGVGRGLFKMLLDDSGDVHGGVSGSGSRGIRTVSGDTVLVSSSSGIVGVEVSGPVVFNTSVFEESGDGVFGEKEKIRRVGKVVRIITERHGSWLERDVVENTVAEQVVHSRSGESDAGVEACRGLEVGEIGIIGKEGLHADMFGTVELKDFASDAETFTTVNERVLPVAAGDGIAVVDVEVGEVDADDVSGAEIGSDIEAGEESVESVLRGERRGVIQSFVVKILTELVRKAYIDLRVKSVGAVGVLIIADTVGDGTVERSVDMGAEWLGEVTIVGRVDVGVEIAFEWPIDGEDLCTHGGKGIADPTFIVEAQFDGVDKSFVGGIGETEVGGAVELANVVGLKVAQKGIVEASQKAGGGTGIDRVEGGSDGLKAEIVDDTDVGTVFAGLYGGADTGPLVIAGGGNEGEGGG
jgi:hypothetical protein